MIEIKPNGLPIFMADEKNVLVFIVFFLSFFSVFYFSFERNFSF